MGRRISTYGIDSVVAGNDRWIGSDVSSGNATMNFTPDGLSLYYIKNGYVDPSKDGLIFTFKPFPTADIKGAFNLRSETSGDIPLDNTLTEVVVSNLDNNRTNIRPLLNYLSGRDIKILNPENGVSNDYAIYTVGTVADHNTNFATVALTYVTGVTGATLASGDTVVLTPISGGAGGSNVTPFVLSDHSVTELNDVTSAGSGSIITALERTNLMGLLTWMAAAEPKLDNIADQANRVGFSPNQVTGASITKSASITDAQGVVSNFNFDDITPLSDAPDTTNILMGINVNGTPWRIRAGSVDPSQGNFVTASLDLSFSGQTDDGDARGDVILTPTWTIPTGASLRSINLQGPGITNQMTVPMDGSGDAITLSNVSLPVGRHTWRISFDGTDDEGVSRLIHVERTLTITAPPVFARAGFDPDATATNLSAADINTFTTSTMAMPAMIDAQSSGTANISSYIWVLLGTDVRFTVIEDGGGPIAFENAMPVTIGGISYNAYRSSAHVVDQGVVGGNSFEFPLTIRYS